MPDLSNYNITLKVLILAKMDDNDGHITKKEVIAKTSYFDIYKHLRTRGLIPSLEYANVENTPDVDYLTYVDNLFEDHLTDYDSIRWSNTTITL